MDRSFEVILLMLAATFASTASKPVSVDVADDNKVERAQEQQSLFEQYFLELAGSDKAIDASELETLLNSQWLGSRRAEFTRDETPSIVARFDEDQDGGLTFSEFEKFFPVYRNSLRVFTGYGTDTIGGHDVVAALKSIDLTVSLNVLRPMLIRFGFADGNEYKLDFEGFLLSSTRLATLIESYQEWKSERKFDQLSIDELATVDV